VRVLIVEDDNNLSSQLAHDLTKAGYAVDTVDNGVEAEFMGREEPYDLIVLDLGLPQRSGLEVLQQWRKAGNKVPVIVLTARDAWHEKVDGFKAGADDYMAKPFHIEELMARMQAVIRRHKDLTGGTFEVAGLTLDEERQTVITNAGETFELAQSFVCCATSCSILANCSPKACSLNMSMNMTPTRTAMSLRSTSTACVRSSVRS